MNSARLTRILLICLLFALLFGHWPAAYAQKPINGNGQIVEQVRPLSAFSAVSLDFPAELTIVNGETPSLVIEGDENVLIHIGTRVRSGKLIISQDKWIEPSAPVKIRVGTPFTSELTTTGYSWVSVEGITGNSFSVDVGVGDVELTGSSGRLLINTKTGNIDATRLDAGQVDVNVASHGRVLLSATNKLIAEMADNGILVFKGNPEIEAPLRLIADSILIRADDYEEEVTPDIPYIEFTLVNNSRRRLQLYVEGPRTKRFSYGFPLAAFGKRKENWPVGTRVYRSSLLGKGELLIEIQADMVDSNVKLFEKE